MVRPTLPETIEYPIPHLHTGKNGLGHRPLFERMVPHAVQVAIELYQHRKDTLVKEELQMKREELDSEASSRMQEMGLPGSIQALEVQKGLPPSLLRKAEELRREGGTKRLRMMTQDALSVASTDRKVLDDVGADATLASFPLGLIISLRNDIAEGG